MIRSKGIWQRLLAFLRPRPRKRAGPQVQTQDQRKIQQVKRIQAYQAATLNAMRREASIYARERQHDGRDVY